MRHKNGSYEAHMEVMRHEVEVMRHEMEVMRHDKIYAS